MNNQTYTLGDVMLACTLELIEVNRGHQIAIPCDILDDLLERRFVTYDAAGNFATTKLGTRFCEGICRDIQAGDLTAQGPAGPLVPDFLPDELA